MRPRLIAVRLGDKASGEVAPTGEGAELMDLAHVSQRRLALVGPDCIQVDHLRGRLCSRRWSGCGTGVLTRVIARWPGVREVVGVDPAPSLLSKARALTAELPNIRFEEADGRSLPFDPHRFDVVVFDSTLSHVPEPERALAEAHRVLRPMGWLATFDGDYSTTTVALGDHDPLQACDDMTMANSVHDRWLMRRLPSLARDCGFEVSSYRSHGFVETHGGYMLTVIDRGADMLCGSEQISAETAAALKAEARRRVETGAFFGHIAYVSLTARKPG